MRLVDDFDEGGQAIADQQLHHQPAEYQPTSGFELVGVERPPHDVAHLGKERLRPLNGAADDLRKKSREEKEHDRVALDRFVVPIDFDEIRDQFERIVGDAERQQ